MCRIHVRHRIAAASVPFLGLFVITPTDFKAQCELLDCHAESATSVEPRKKPLLHEQGPQVNLFQLSYNTGIEFT